MAHAHTAVSQGDRSLRSDRARRDFGVNGRGVRVGVLSDSYDCAPGAFQEGAPFTRAAQDIASGDLPRDVLLLKDLDTAPSNDCSDEGRAMMQIIHDVAPGSPLAFYTAFVSQEDFAAGIRALAKAGSKVIVDDIIYYAEPMFEDGIIAQAVDDVYKNGVAYFSSAGNDARASERASPSCRRRRRDVCRSPTSLATSPANYPRCARARDTFRSARTATISRV
jgi:subtilisin family serine protease